jgi:hypothetical protein
MVVNKTCLQNEEVPPPPPPLPKVVKTTHIKTFAYQPFCATIRNPLSTPGTNCFGTFVPIVSSTNSSIVF